ncbi:hypothetical protein H5410_030455, partial [Solanum commersonii]
SFTSPSFSCLPVNNAVDQRIQQPNKLLAQTLPLGNYYDTCYFIGCFICLQVIIKSAVSDCSHLSKTPRKKLQFSCFTLPTLQHYDYIHAKLHSSNIVYNYIHSSSSPSCISLNLKHISTSQTAQTSIAFSSPTLSLPFCCINSLLSTTPASQQVPNTNSALPIATE